MLVPLAFAATLALGPPIVGEGGPAGPQPAPDLPVGSVEVLVTHVRGRSLSPLAVTVVERSSKAKARRYGGTTNEGGRALVEGIEGTPDAQYVAEAEYGGAPFASEPFALPSGSGLRIPLLVSETTSERARIRAALIVDVVDLGGGTATVFLACEIEAPGPQGFWDPKLTIPLPKADDVSVMPRSTADVEIVGRLARLRRAIPSGEYAEFSVAYTVEHHGTVAVEWEAPFQLAAAHAHADRGLVVSAPGARKIDALYGFSEGDSYLLRPGHGGRSVALEVSGFEAGPPRAEPEPVAPKTAARGRCHVSASASPVGVGGGAAWLLLLLLLRRRRAQSR